MSELGFHIEKRGSVHVAVYDSGGVNPVTGTIVKLWEERMEMIAGLESIANWSPEEEDVHRVCRLQWRGCVAIARKLLGMSMGEVFGGEARPERVQGTRGVQDKSYG